MSNNHAPKIALINIMDNARGTEKHFLRTLHGAHPDAQITLCRMACAESDAKYFKEQDYLLTERYRNWQDVIGNEHFDLVIVTGIDRGLLTYEDMSRDYKEFWDESCTLFRTLLSETSKGTVNHISLVCWSAFAAMKELYGVEKFISNTKLYGLFDHKIETPSHPLATGLGDDKITVPQSRYSYMDEAALRQVIKDHNGEVVMSGPSNSLSNGPVSGPAVWTLENRKITCFINHFEYSIDTLSREYERGKQVEGEDFTKPQNYDFENINSPSQNEIFDRLSKSCTAFYRNMINHAAKNISSKKPITLAKAA